MNPNEYGSLFFIFFNFFEKEGVYIYIYNIFFLGVCVYFGGPIFGRDFGLQFGGLYIPHIHIIQDSHDDTNVIFLNYTESKNQ